MTLDQNINIAIAIGTWLAGIATFLAVWVSLYLANRISVPRAQVSIGHRIIVESGVASPHKEFVLFHIVNSGDRTLRVTQIGWKVGLLKKRFAIQLYDASLSSALPIELTHGQEAKWFVPLDAREEPWLIHFSKKMLMPNFHTSCLTLKGQVFTSLGHVFEAKPEHNLISKLKEAFIQHIKHQG